MGKGGCFQTCAFRPLIPDFRPLTSDICPSLSAISVPVRDYLFILAPWPLCLPRRFGKSYWVARLFNNFMGCPANHSALQPFTQNGFGLKWVKEMEAVWDCVVYLVQDLLDVTVVGIGVPNILLDFLLHPLQRPTRLQALCLLVMPNRLGPCLMIHRVIGQDRLASHGPVVPQFLMQMRVLHPRKIPRPIHADIRRRQPLGMIVLLLPLMGILPPQPQMVLRIEGIERHRFFQSHYPQITQITQIF